MRYLLHLLGFPISLFNRSELRVIGAILGGFEKGIRQEIEKHLQCVSFVVRTPDRKQIDMYARGRMAESVSPYLFKQLPEESIIARATVCDDKLTELVVAMTQVHGRLFSIEFSISPSLLHREVDLRRIWISPAITASRGAASVGDLASVDMCKLYGILPRSYLDAVDNGFQSPAGTRFLGTLVRRVAVDGKQLLIIGCDECDDNWLAILLEAGGCDAERAYVLLSGGDPMCCRRLQTSDLLDAMRQLADFSAEMSRMVVSKEVD